MVGVAASALPPAEPQDSARSGEPGLSRGARVQARGEVHHDRRLHQMMLAEEVKAWDRRVAAGAADGGAAAPAPPAAEDACCAPRPAGAPAADPDAAPCFSGRGAAPGALARGAAAAGGGAAAAPQASPNDSASSLHGLLCTGSDAAMLYRCGLRAHLLCTYKAWRWAGRAALAVIVKHCLALLILSSAGAVGDWQQVLHKRGSCGES